MGERSEEKGATATEGASPYPCESRGKGASTEGATATEEAKRPKREQGDRRGRQPQASEASDSKLQAS